MRPMHEYQRVVTMEITETEAEGCTLSSLGAWLADKNVHIASYFVTVGSY